MIYEIYPRRERGRWFFNDPTFNITNEELVHGVDTILDIMCAGKRRLTRGIRLHFADEPMPGSVQLNWQEGSETGDWYIATEKKTIGWFCPTLRTYFPQGAPPQLFLKASFLKGDESWESLLRDQQSQDTSCEG